MTKDTYILQRDLPDSKAGDKYIYLDSMVKVNAYYRNGNGCEGYWLKEFVENNPLWFLKQEVKLKWEIDAYSLENAPILSLNDIIKYYDSPQDSPLFLLFYSKLKTVINFRLEMMAHKKEIIGCKITST